jgi:hypothetical protein
MVNSVSFPTPQAYSSGFDFTPLANLGNVYRQAQEQQAQQTALGQLGNDAGANAQVLIKSGVPSLAQLGMRMQQQAVQDAETRREFDLGYTLRQHADTRAGAAEARAARAERENTPEFREAKIKAAFGGAVPPEWAAYVQTGAGAPSYGQTEDLKIRQAQEERQRLDFQKRQADEAAAAQTVARLAGPKTDAFTTGAPPVTGSSGVGDTTAPTGEVSPVDRVSANLTSPQPTSAAGVSNNEIGELYRNPLTRPLATAFLEKQLAPGKWKYEKLPDGRLIAVSETDPTRTKDVTPGGAVSKEQAEYRNLLKTAKEDFGMSDDEAKAWAANKGKTPKQEDLSVTEKKMVDAANEKARAADDAILNLKKLKELSPKAWSGGAGSFMATGMGRYLPGSLTPEGALNVQELVNITHQNVLQQLKPLLGARPAVYEAQLLKQLETTPEMSDELRQRVYDRLIKTMQSRGDDAAKEAEGIRNRTYFKPGGYAPGSGAPAPEAAAVPNLKEFMIAARKANPNATDSELAQYWKQEYGRK